MKRFFKIGAAVAGFLALGLVACTDGNGDWMPEIPTNYGEVNADYSGSGVAAKWDFSGLSQNSTAEDNVWGLARLPAEAPFPEKGLDENGSIKLTDGTSAEGATLVPFGSWNTNDNILQGKRDSVTISDVSSSTRKNAPGFTLTLKEQANIVIVARGAGAADAQRFLVIFDKNDTKLAYKDKLASGASNNVTFTVKGATPERGPYTIVANGAAICSIDLSSESTSLTKPSEITELKIDKPQDEIEEFEAYETLTLAVSNVYTNEDNIETKKEMTKEAVWTSSDEKVATVKEGVVTGVGAGTAVIRARIGRFYDERKVTVTPSTKTRAIFFSKDQLPEQSTELGLDWTADTVKNVADKLLKAVVAGDFVTVSDAKITFFDDNTSWSVKPTALAASDIDTTKAWDGGYGVQMKPDKYNGAKFAQNFTFCKISFDVTPTSDPVKVGLSIVAKGGKNVNVGTSLNTAVVKVGSGSAGNNQITQDVAITEKTSVTVSFSVADADKDGVGFGFHDLVLMAQLAE